MPVNESSLRVEWNKPAPETGILSYLAYAENNHALSCSTDKSELTCDINGFSPYENYSVCVVACDAPIYTVDSSSSFAETKPICSLPSCLSNFTLPASE